MRVAFFIDGQNLFHTLKDLDKKLKEENIDWSKLFSNCLEEGESIEFAYWFRPKEIKEQVFLSRNRLYRQIIREKYRHNQEALLSNLGKLPREIFNVVRLEYEERLDWWKNEKRRFWNVHRKYKSLESEYDFIKIYSSGVLKMDTYEKKPIGEKGVDVAIAVNIIESVLVDNCDRVVLVSGDSDYEEVANVLKRHGKNITCLSFENAISKRLSNLVDGVYNISLIDLQGKYQK